MPLASVILEIKKGAGEHVLAGLKQIPQQISIFGMTENQIVIVIRADDPGTMRKALKEVKLIEGVINLYAPYVAR